jgi:hypothetical protein
MANTLSNFIREIWAPDVQSLAMDRLVAKQICNFQFQGADGDTFHKPYHGDLSVGSYTRNATSSAVSATDIATTDEYLTVDQAKYASFYVDRLDEKQMYVSLEEKMKMRAAYLLRDTIDTAVLAEYANAGLQVDYKDVKSDESDGEPIALSTTNCLDVLAHMKSKLELNGAYNNDDYFIVVDPNKYYTIMEKYLATNGYKVQDSAVVNGYQGKILGVEVYVSNNLATSTISGVTTRHWLGGKKGAITLLVQQEPRLEVKDLPQNDDGTIRLGTQYIIWTLYGKKTFTEGARELVDILIAD